MRVISGSARGIKLSTIPEYTTRPTVDRVKENLFNIIQNRIMDRIVLDLFAGSGSLCIECLSRGAARAVLIEKNPKCLPVIRDNLERTRLIGRAEIRNEDFEQFLIKHNSDKEKFDIIFLDPPHNKGLGLRAMDLIASKGALQDEGMIVVEHHAKEVYPDIYAGFIREKFKKYGNTALSFYVKEAADEDSRLSR